MHLSQTLNGTGRLLFSQVHVYSFFLRVEEIREETFGSAKNWGLLVFECALSNGILSSDLKKSVKCLSIREMLDDFALDALLRSRLPFAFLTVREARCE